MKTETRNTTFRITQTPGEIWSTEIVRRDGTQFTPQGKKFGLEGYHVSGMGLRKTIFRGSKTDCIQECSRLGCARVDRKNWMEALDGLS